MDRSENGSPGTVLIAGRAASSGQPLSSSSWRPDGTPSRSPAESRRWRCRRVPSGMGSATADPAAAGSRRRVRHQLPHSVHGNHHTKIDVLHWIPDLFTVGAHDKCLISGSLAKRSPQLTFRRPSPGFGIIRAERSLGLTSRQRPQTFCGHQMPKAASGALRKPPLTCTNTL